MQELPADPYVRPTWPGDTFRDEHGVIIEYGSRWSDSPPDWAYTSTSNLARFAPLHLVANALIDHLVAAFRVRVFEDERWAQGLEPPPPDHFRVVRLESSALEDGSLTMVFSTFPGIVLYAGRRYEAFPACGCDACDDPVDRVADQLEQWVLSLVRPASTKGPGSIGG